MCSNEKASQILYLVGLVMEILRKGINHQSLAGNAGSGAVSHLTLLDFSQIDNS